MYTIDYFFSFCRSASRDNTCKEWNLFPTANLSCDFALPRDEAYAHSSVWAVDANERFVVYGTQDCYVVVRDGLLGTRANMKGHFMGN